MQRVVKPLPAASGMLCHQPSTMHQRLIPCVLLSSRNSLDLVIDPGPQQYSKRRFAWLSNKAAHAVLPCPCPAPWTSLLAPAPFPEFYGESCWHLLPMWSLLWRKRWCMFCYLRTVWSESLPFSLSRRIWWWRNHPLISTA